MIGKLTKIGFGTNSERWKREIEKFDIVTIFGQNGKGVGYRDSMEATWVDLIKKCLKHVGNFGKH